MNTHERTDLPPLPPHPPVAHMGGRHAQADCQFPVLYAWAKAYARAAIEADRKRRGEPIGVEIAALIANMAAFLEVSGDPYADPLVKHAREVLSAPQPAEPVKPRTKFEDERVQKVYEIICGDNQPPYGEHWDGYVSRLIVDALFPPEPEKVPSDDERAAQGLPPYNPRLPTDEEMKRLTENGRKAWGKDDTEPVKVPSDDEILHLADIFLYSAGKNYGIIQFARALLARYGAQPAASVEPRRIGRIVLDANRHPRAVLETGYDEQGNQWPEGTAIYAAPVAAQPQPNHFRDATKMMPAQQPVGGADDGAPLKAFDGETHVAVPIGILGACKYAIEKKKDAPILLAELRRYAFGDLSIPVPQPQPSRDAGDALAAFDAAVATVLPRISTLKYNSQEICTHFAGEVRAALTAMEKQK